MTILSEKLDTIEKYMAVDEHTPSGTHVRLRDYDMGSNQLLRPTTPPHGHTTYLPRVNSAGFAGYHGPEYWPKALWWLHREQMRLSHGVYQPLSPTLVQLVVNSPHLGQYALHISRENPEQIAWTPTVDDGLRDRQVAMSLGRWLRRVFPGIADHEITQLESAHRTFLNPDVEFIDCMTDMTRVISAYMGVTSCMSKSTSHWGHGHHPLEAYGAPGFKLAVIYGAGKKISGRCLVWINPEDENDKRAVRNYGDDSLRQYLKTKGFVFTNLGGAYLKAIPVESNTKLVVPYVDTAGCEVQPNTATSGVHDGDGKIWLFDTKTILRIPKDHWVAVQTQHGSTAMRTFPLNGECAVSGKKINIMRDTTSVVYIDGKRKQALSSQVRDWITCNVMIDGGVAAMLVHPTAAMFKHSGSFYIDTTAAREYCGYVKLDPAFYPDVTEWLVANNHELVRTASNTWIKDEDSVYLCSPTANLIHRSQLPADAVRVAQVHERKAFAVAGVEYKVTAANRKVIPGVHDVVEGYNGVWGYRRSMKSVKFWGREVWVPIAMTMEELAAATPTMPEAVINEIRRHAAKGHNREALIRHQIFTILNDRGDCYAPVSRNDDGEFGWTYHFESRDLNVAVIEAAVAAPDKSPPGWHSTLAQMKTIIEVCDRVHSEAQREAVPA